VALALAGANFSVVIAGRREQPLNAVSEAARAAGSAVSRVVADVTDEAAVTALFAGIVNQYGRLDLLFNNAGAGGQSAPIEALSLDAWTSAVATNLTSAFLCTREAVRIMKGQVPRGGRIINNGSISAHAPRPNSTLYTTTKHAMTGLTKSTSLDGRDFDIACGQIDIGNAATDMTARIAEGTVQPDGRIEPEPRMNVDDVARAVVFMASLPLDANVQFMTVMATKMPYIGRG
jgi:NAD(P)-dependent dehydrogenase (short-subunit alcohol dehydrogenase family)